MRFMMLPLALVALAPLALVGCGDDGPEPGVADAIAEEACGHLAHAATPVTAADESADAPGVVLADGEPYDVTLPASGVGYVVFDAPYEHYDWAFFISDNGRFDARLEHLSTGAIDSMSPSAPNGACPGEGVLDHRAHMHHMGLFLVEIHGEPGDTVWVMIVGEPSDHFEHPDDHHDDDQHHD